jgi:hypothetical protein
MHSVNGPLESLAGKRRSFLSRVSLHRGTGLGATSAVNFITPLYLFHISIIPLYPIQFPEFYVAITLLLSHNPNNTIFLDYYTPLLCFRCCTIRSESIRWCINRETPTRIRFLSTDLGIILDEFLESMCHSSSRSNDAIHSRINDTT